MQRLVGFVMILLLSGCFAVCPTPKGFERRYVQTRHFTISIWEKTSIKSGHPLRLYFEGDGNPNPRIQVAKQLAESDKTDNIIYITRPCQWSNDKICDEKPNIYQDQRFHEEIMAEMEELTHYLIRKHKAPSVELIGYDGGAVIALNMAVKLPTTRIITVAGITDIEAYNTYHGKETPEDTENPVSHLAVLQKIPQIHYVGKDDTITPRHLVEHFVTKMSNPKSAVVKLVPNTGHADWEGVTLDY